MMATHRKISVVIATKNRFQDIVKCIESILVQTVLPDEIVIVDASDTQELKSKIKEFKSEKTKIIYLHTKAGMTYQWNIGVENSCGDVVFILDDDTVLENAFIKEIVNVFENDKGREIGGVCGDQITIKNQNRSVIHSIFSTISKILTNIFFLSKMGNGKFRLSGFQTWRFGTDKIANVDFLPGGLTAYRKEVFEDFSFDENIRFMADGEFSYRVSRKYQNVYTPYARLVHDFSPIARENIYLRRKLFIESYCHHFKKNLPQTFKHKFAFYMSIYGLFVMEIIDMVRTRNADGLKGLKDGLLEIRGKRKEKRLS